MRAVPFRNLHGATGKAPGLLRKVGEEGKQGLEAERLGSIAGLLGGTAAMGTVLALAFDAQRAIVKIIAVLFVLNALGYFLGGWIEGKLAIEHRPAAMLLWGVCYGIGFGAGLGVAFRLCQEDARQAIRRQDAKR